MSDSHQREFDMYPPIHGAGRIVFEGYSFQYLMVSAVYPIPNGPALDEAFIREGVAILKANPHLELPPVVVYPKNDRPFDKQYWIIEGRHRLQSYMRAERKIIPCVVGERILILPKLDTV